MKSGLENLRNHGFRLMDQVNNCDHCATLVNNCCSRCGENLGESSTRPLQYPGSQCFNVQLLLNSGAENVDRSGATPFYHLTPACISCSECFNSIRIADTSCSDCGRSVECSHPGTEQILSGQQELDDATMDSFVVLDLTDSYTDFENSPTGTTEGLLPPPATSAGSSHEMLSLTNPPESLSSGELNHRTFAVHEVSSTAPEVLRMEQMLRIFQKIQESMHSTMLTCIHSQMTSAVRFLLPRGCQLEMPRVQEIPERFGINKYFLIFYS